MKMAELSNAAFGRWPGILATLGANAAHLKNIHGPCPFCGGKDRFRFGDEGVGRWFCNQCGHGDGFDYLQRLNSWDLKRTKGEVIAVLGVVPVAAARLERNPEHKADYMRKVWAESMPVIPGDPVWCYLSRRCGDPAGYLGDIRHHPALRHSVSGTEHPAMVARMRTRDGKKAIGLHRTFLTHYGFKAEVDPVRMTFGEIGTIRLGGLQDRLGIAEGIETAICASKSFRLPVWAATCANGLENWAPPEGVGFVVVFGDSDHSFTGQASAMALAHRLHREGLQVDVQLPPVLGKDWADLFLEEIS